MLMAYSLMLKKCPGVREESSGKGVEFFTARIGIRGRMI